MKRKLPITRELEWRFDNGWTAGRVDRAKYTIQRGKKAVPIMEDWPGAGHGIIDLVCAKIGEPGSTYVQVTSRSNHADRVSKVCAEKHIVRTLLLSGNQVEVVSYGPEDDDRKVQALGVSDVI